MLGSAFESVNVFPCIFCNLNFLQLSNCVRLNLIRMPLIQWMLFVFVFCVRF